MRSTLVLVCTLLALAAGPSAARAFCGFYVAGADRELYNNATLVVMMREGTRTVLSMQNNYEGPPEDFAMVVPVPVVLQEENVKTLPKDVFDRVDTLAAPRLVEYWEQDPCMMERLERTRRPRGAGQMMMEPEAAAEEAEAPMVTIEAQFEVGEYDIVILSARDSTALDTWLRQNGYSIPEGAEPILRPYVESGSKFFVAKVDIERVQFENGQAMLSPLRVHYDSEDFSLPVRLGLLNSKGHQDLLVHILAPNQRYEVANYENVTIPTNLDVADAAREQFGAFYAALFDRTLEQNPGAVVTEYAWQATNCDPCPGPVLSASDLTTLGADVLPSTSTGMVGRVSIGQPAVQGDVNQAVAQAVLQSSAAGVQTCLDQAMGRGLSSGGSVSARLTVGANGLVSGTPQLRGAGDAALRSCVGEALSGVRFPPPGNGQPAQVTVPISLSVQPSNPWEVQQRLNSFVLTRLHARYTKDSLEDDLVFRPADPIVGGREMPGSDGALEKGAQPSSVNNFQGRYAIRHPWEGPITCANPRRGVWGGPPAGLNRPAGPQAAQDLAFAPRGQVRLTDMLKQDVPELELTAAAAATPVTGATPEVPTTPAASTGGASDGGACDCRATGGTAGPLGLGLFAVAFAMLLWRRRR